MGSLSRLLRWLLNINTIWGLMIVAAFAACVAQHYLPTTTMLPASQLHPGDNKVTISIGKDAPKVFDASLVWQDGKLLIPPLEHAKNHDRPWFISATQAGDSFALKWDYDGYGEYRFSLNDKPLKKGLLETLPGLTDSAFEYARKAFNIALGLVAAMVLFLGLMKVGEEAGIVQLAARVFHPIIRLAFPEVPKEHPASGAILMNITTSILGLGNAATPFGIKAMQELQTLNPHPEVATNSQIMLLAYNTAGFALLPTMLLAVRKSAGCSDPFEIIGTCMLTGAASTLVALIMARLLGKLPFFSVRAALAERTPEEIAAMAEQAAASDNTEEQA